MQPNFQGRYYEGIAWTFTGLAIIVVAIRIFTRTILTRTFGWDDFFILIALSFTIIGNVGDHFAVDSGLGYHTDQLTQTELLTVTKWTYLDIIFNFTCLFFLRTSIILFIMKLVPRIKRWPFYLLWSFLALNFVSSAVALITYGLKCVPYRAIWEPWIPHHCLSDGVLATVLVVNAALGCVTDFVTASTPIIILRNVQMHRKTRYMLFGIFGLGLCIASCSIGRAITVTPSRLANDPTRSEMPALMFGLFEEKLGIIISCLPAVRQLFVHLRRQGKQQSDDSNTIAGTTATTATSATTGTRKSTRSKESRYQTSVYGHLKDTVGFRASKHVPNNVAFTKDGPYPLAKNPDGAVPLSPRGFTRIDSSITEHGGPDSTRYPAGTQALSEKQSKETQSTENYYLKEQPSHDSSAQDFGDGRALLRGKGGKPISYSDGGYKA